MMRIGMIDNIYHFENQDIDPIEFEDYREDMIEYIINYCNNRFTRLIWFDYNEYGFEVVGFNEQD